MTKRLDQLVQERFDLPSRERARSLIMQGRCFVNGQRADKPGLSVKSDDEIKLNLPSEQYVSRGAYKLKQASEQFSIDFKDKTVMDIGASTGGFCDFALQNGAEKVYAVDVGYGQLDYRLRCDERVVCLERTNARYLEPEKVHHKIELFTVDVSFISLFHIFPLFKKFAAEEFVAVVLIKPQFEAGREQVGKNGVVRDAAVHREVIEKVLSFAKQDQLYPFGLYHSPIKGPKGNIEFLLTLSNRPSDFSPNVEEVVKTAHIELSMEDNR